jgi:hypothetical protein
MVLKFLRPLLLAGALSLGSMTLLAAVLPCDGSPPPAVRERFSPELASIRSVSQAEAYIRSRVPPDASDAQIADAIEDFAQRRFVHGFSSYRMCDNWIAYLAGGFRYDLKVPIDADEILQYDRAMCTQNTLVIHALLKRFGIEYAAFTFWRPLHMAPAARIEGKWALYDGDIETKRTGIVSLDEVMQGDALETIYAGFLGNPEYPHAEDLGRQFKHAAKLGKVRLQDVNRSPGDNGRLFQAVTRIASWYGWLVLAILYLSTISGPRNKAVVAWRSASSRLRTLLTNFRARRAAA